MPDTASHRTFRHMLAAAARRLGLSRAQPVVMPLDGSNHLSQVVVRVHGREINLVVRPNTCDLDLVNLIVCHDSEYRLPQVVQPRVIFDIGANIGVTAAYYSAIYPDADIYCFEPFPDNVELLRQNATRNSDRIHVIAKGLSDTIGTLDYTPSSDPRNFGGGGFQSFNNETPVMKLPVTTVANAMSELHLGGVDVFKIDTEGSELAILRGIPSSVLSKAQAVIGELHGVGDWDACQLLSQSHSLGIQKRIDRQCFNFVALRKDLAQHATAAKAA